MGFSRRIWVTGTAENVWILTMGDGKNASIIHSSARLSQSTVSDRGLIISLKVKRIEKKKKNHHLKNQRYYSDSIQSPRHFAMTP